MVRARTSGNTKLRRWKYWTKLSKYLDQLIKKTSYRFYIIIRKSCFTVKKLCWNSVNSLSTISTRWMNRWGKRCLSVWFYWPIEENSI